MSVVHPILSSQNGEYHRNRKHGLSRSPEHCAWIRMKGRCYNPKNHGYKWYGGRGIKVCDRWINSFEAFLADMGPRPSKKHSLDRFPDVNGNYEPKNCRWATSREQQMNKRNNRRIECDGETKTISEWAEISGIPQSVIGRRLQNGFTVRYAIFAPGDKYGKNDGKKVIPGVMKLTIDGITKTITEWSKESPVSDEAIRYRLRRGMSPKDAVYTARKGS